MLLGQMLQAFAQVAAWGKLQRNSSHRGAARAV